MKKKSIWRSPPSYGGPKDNKRALKQLSKMCDGLSAMASADKPSVASQLASLGTSMSIKISIAGRNKAYIFPNIVKGYEILTSLRTALCEDGNAEDIELYLKSLETEVRVLGTFLEHEIDDSPMEANMNRFVKKFITKKSAVEAIARATESSLVEAEKKLQRLQYSVPQNEREKQRLEQKIANLKSFIEGRRNAADTLSSIVDRLIELEDTARLSPGLSRRINKLIRLNLIADFYDSPMRSNKEREKLYMHLYYIARNQKDAELHTKKLDNLLNRPMVDEVSEPVIESQETTLTVESIRETHFEKHSQTESEKQKNLNIGGKI